MGAQAAAEGRRGGKSRWTARRQGRLAHLRVDRRRQDRDVLALSCRGRQGCRHQRAESIEGLRLAERVCVTARVEDRTSVLHYV